MAHCLQYNILEIYCNPSTVGKNTDISSVKERIYNISNLQSTKEEGLNLWFKENPQESSAVVAGLVPIASLHVGDCFFIV